MFNPEIREYTENISIDGSLSDFKQVLKFKIIRIKKVFL
jgi:hypothetical protein